MFKTQTRSLFCTKSGDYQFRCFSFRCSSSCVAAPVCGSPLRLKIIAWLILLDQSMSQHAGWIVSTVVHCDGYCIGLIPQLWFQVMEDYPDIPPITYFKHVLTVFSLFKHIPAPLCTLTRLSKVRIKCCESHELLRRFQIQTKRGLIHNFITTESL